MKETKKQKQINKTTTNKKRTVGAGLVSAQGISTKGITLISLVITIIIMLILANVAINLTLGDNGIFTKAKEAKEKMEIAMIKEQIQMDILTEQLGSNGKISEDKLKEILDKYGEVQTDEEGKITGVITDEGGYYIPIEDILDREEITPPTPEEPGGKITNITLNRNTLELKVGEKETLTITIQPENIENKEVEWTSDNKAVATVDAYGEVTALKEGTAIITVSAKSDNTIKDQCTVIITKSVPLPGEGGYEGGAYNAPYIPIGFKHIGTEEWNQGYTIIGETSSVGNEFVWVPCVLTVEEQQAAKTNNGHDVQIFQKTTTGKYIQGGMTITGDTSEADDIKTSVGTYGGFYIAKYEAGIPGTTKSVTTDHKTSTSGDILPVSQPNVGVWNFINRTNALSLSNKMIDHNATGVHSTLISGAAWDTTLQWITNTVDETYAEDSTNKGNYSRTLAVTSSNLNTAYSKNNIYDMAGNVWEWTTENCTFSGFNGLVCRGRLLQL